MIGNKWYKTAFRRNVVDMHITEDDPRFMSQFDPETYAETLALSNVDSAVVYAHSHVGLCYYPTKVGRMHKNLKGRDVLRDLIDQCHRRNISVVVYYSLIHDTWAHRSRRDWRIINAEGKATGDRSRYGLCCPNSPYRDHVVAQVEELCEWYDFEGIRFDMTFWPWPCYCRYCRKRFAEEVGGAIPRRIDWDNPKWVAFQRRREQWLVEFAALVTSTVRRLKPHASVEHQSSTYTVGWPTGVTVDLADQNDFLQGDFYGGVVQGSFVCKLLQNTSPNLPFGFETSISVSLGDHTTLKSKELMRARNYQAIANSGSFIFIDAIDPAGTLDRKRYEMMGEIFTESRAYDAYLGGQACADVAIYLSTESKYDPADTRRKPTEVPLMFTAPHVEAGVGAARACMEHNIPYTVVTRRNLDDLSRYQVVVLPNVLMMSRREAEAIRRYVQNGGRLYASKSTSLRTPDGAKQKNFLLSDLFGVSFTGQTAEDVTYIAPTRQGLAYFEGHDDKYPVFLPDSQITTKAMAGTKVLATLALPYTHPKEWRRFASIHSNPPGEATDQPAVVLNKVGKGRVIYVTGDLEKHQCHQDIFINLIRLLAKRAFWFESDAPHPVEITMFHQADKKRFIVNVLNFQDRTPNLPVHDITVRIPLRRRKPRRLLKLPDETPVRYRTRNGRVEFVLPRLETFEMFALQYK